VILGFGLHTIGQRLSLTLCAAVIVAVGFVSSYVLTAQPRPR
jgi:hypothetical protein